MDVLFVYCDTGAPSRYLRYLDVGAAHQVLADNRLAVESLLVPALASPAALLDKHVTCTPRLTAVYFDEFNLHASLTQLKELRQVHPDVQVVGFGIFPVLGPEKIMGSRLVDYLVIGEGEIALLELVTHLDRPAELQSIRNLWWRQDGKVQRNPLRPLQENLDLIPYANRSLFEQEALAAPDTERVLYMSASRGCPYECLFCYSPVIKRAYEGKGTYYRFRSAGHISGELLGEMRRGTYGEVVFVDEMFPTERSFLKVLGQRLGGREPVAFQCTLSVERCDRETLQLLHAAGCRRICLGVETGNEAFRKRIATRNVGNQKLEALIAQARELEIGIVITTLIGLPLESEPLLQETYKYAQSLNPDSIACTVYNPIEATQLYHYARDKNYIDSSAASAPDFTTLNMQLPELTADAVRAYLYRMHFLNVVQRLKSFPQSGGSFDFLRELPKARFKLQHSRAVDIGKTARRGKPYGYFLLESGSELRYSITLNSASILRFAVMIAGASIRKIRDSGAKLLSEVIWSADGRDEVLFCRLTDSAEGSLAQRWHDCIAEIPEEAEKGEVIFRVSTIPAGDFRVSVLWGMPCLVEQRGGISAIGSEALRAGFDEQMASRDAHIKRLEQQLEETRRELHLAQEERDRKAQRVSELQIKLVETEKKLEEWVNEADQLRLQLEAGISGKLKNIFKK